MEIGGVGALTARYPVTVGINSSNFFLKFWYRLIVVK